jgi:predicted Zn-dependent protease
MAILTRDEAFAILDKVLGYSRADGCEVSLGGSAGGNIRYARNTVTTAGATQDLNLAVQSNFGKKLGTATVNELDDASLEKVVRRSEDLARLAPENPEFMPPLGPQNYSDPKAYFPDAAAVTPAYRATAAGHSIGPCREKDLVAAGFLTDGAGFQAMATSAGLRAYHRSTGVEFSVTVRTPDGTGSGWVSRDYNDVGLLDTARASAIAIEKAARSREPRAIEPGKYTVILEPAAAAGLLQFLVGSFDARTADEGRSFLSAGEGKTKLGEKIVDERVTLYSDPMNPSIPSTPWGDDGLPRVRTPWIEKGVVKNLFTSRYWAKEKGREPVPSPSNGVMEGGDASLEDLIRDTRRGILVTRTWYIRSVDPQTLLLTGLTRDGTFFLEDGKIAYPVKNMRWNVSPVIMLNNLEALGKPERTDGNLVPPVKVREFDFTSLSDAV